MASLQIPVRLQKLRKGKAASNSSTERCRTHYGTVYFPEGTTANEVSVYIARQYQGPATSMGLWLLQTASGEVKDGQLEQADDGSFRTSEIRSTSWRTAIDTLRCTTQVLTSTLYNLKEGQEKVAVGEI